MKLSEIIEQHLRGQVAVEGESSSLTARLLDGEARASMVHLRYDPKFWAAFAVPITVEGRLRALKTSRPFQFDDFEDGTVPTGWQMIEADFIPAADLPKQERQARIRDAIIAWCTRRNLDPGTFVRDEPMRPATGSAVASGDKLGVEVLMRLISVIPANERSKYALPLDLVHKLLTLTR